MNEQMTKMADALAKLKARQARLEADGRQIDHALDSRIVDLEGDLADLEEDYWSRRTQGGLGY